MADNPLPGDLEWADWPTNDEDWRKQHIDALIYGETFTLDGKRVDPEQIAAVAR